LENTHPLRKFHISHAGDGSSENVIKTGKGNPSNAVQADVLALGTIGTEMAPVVDVFFLLMMTNLT
jgi:3,4-dihydroxy 2-butanone 4-phosphate synthase / GTP cyclohydrolase II